MLVVAMSLSAVGLLIVILCMDSDGNLYTVGALYPFLLLLKY